MMNRTLVKMGLLLAGTAFGVGGCGDDEGGDGFGDGGAPSAGVGGSPAGGANNAGTGKGGAPNQAGQIARAGTLASAGESDGGETSMAGREGESGAGTSGGTDPGTGGTTAGTTGGTTAGMNGGTATGGTTAGTNGGTATGGTTAGTSGGTTGGIALGGIMNAGGDSGGEGGSAPEPGTEGGMGGESGGPAEGGMGGEGGAPAEPARTCMDGCAELGLAVSAWGQGREWEIALGRKVDLTGAVVSVRYRVVQGRVGGFQVFAKNGATRSWGSKYQWNNLAPEGQWTTVTLDLSTNLGGLYVSEVEYIGISYGTGGAWNTTLSDVKFDVDSITVSTGATGPYEFLTSYAPLVLGWDPRGAAAPGTLAWVQPAP